MLSMHFPNKFLNNNLFNVGTFLQSISGQLCYLFILSNLMPQCNKPSVSSNIINCIFLQPVSALAWKYYGRVLCQNALHKKIKQPSILLICIELISLGGFTWYYHLILPTIIIIRKHNVCVWMTKHLLTKVISKVNSNLIHVLYKELILLYLFQVW